MASTVSNLTVTLVLGTDRELLARWNWSDTTNTDHFDVSWQYHTGNGIWISGNESTAKETAGSLRQSTYTAPNNAYKVRVAVKVVGKTKTSSKKNSTSNDTYYSDATFCNFVEYSFNNKVADTPPDISKYVKLYEASIKRHPAEESTVYFDLNESSLDGLAGGALKYDVAIQINSIIESITTNERAKNLHRHVALTYLDAFAGYDYEWQYKSSGTWFPGNSGNSGTDTIITYQYPVKATDVRLRLKAVSNEYESLIDGQSHAFFTQKNFTSWLSVKISDIVEKPPVYEAYDIESDKITISLATGSASSVIVRFPEYTAEYVNSYSYVCYYKDVTSGKWINDSSGSTGTAETARYFTYDPPTGAKEIGFKIKPVSKTYKKYGTDNYYWTTPWSNLRSVKMSAFNAKIEKKDAIARTSIVINFLNNVPGTLYAAWPWTEKQVQEPGTEKHSDTDKYEYEWEYFTGATGPNGNIWLEGDYGDSVNKNCTYSIPTGAKQVRFRVKPIAKTYIDSYGRELSYWTTKFSDWYNVTNVERPKPVKISPPDKFIIWSLPSSERTAYATIPWTREHTDHASYKWGYAIKNSSGAEIWYEDSSESSTYSYQNGAFNVPNYSIPNNAVKIRIKAKIIAETYEDQHFGDSLEYWQTDFSEWSNPPFDLADLDPPTPSSGPSIDLAANGRLTATVLDYVTVTADRVEFQILQDNSKVIASGENVRVMLNEFGYAELKYIVPTDGHTYMVRYRGVMGTSKFGEWSAWSESKSTGPATPKSLISAQAYGVDRVKLTWDRVDSADTYVIEYIDEKELFDVSGNVKTEETSDNVTMYVTNHFSGDDFGKTWYFRVKAKNNTGSSGWTNVLSCTLARTPSAPTTWSETGVIPLGDIARLFWVHNAEDNSNETQATITYRLSTDPENPIEVVIDDEPSDENVSDMIHTYEIDTSEYETGCMIYWSVKTKGAAPDYSESSVERQIGVYANPTVSFSIESELTALPISFTATAEPPQQTAISWNASITALDEYSTVDNVGNTIHVNAGQVIYSKFMDISGNTIDVSIGAGDVTLENNIRYSISVKVGMDSGLSASSAHEFTVNFSYDVSTPDAEIMLNDDDFSASIRPYAYNNDLNAYDPAIVLSVYRKEYDGRFVAIAKNLANTGYTSVIDPHPSLNSARYRIVATSLNTGHSSYIDLSGASFNVAGMVIQWGDAWSEYDPDMSGDRVYEEPKWTGSLIHLPYNVDISEEVDPDVALIEYIGRSAPVTYFGTQLGVGGSWSTVIAANDYDTIYALRRLAIYRGNAYIRSSNGIGYWAQVNVSFQKTNREVTIPVTFTVKRVEGGI